MAEPDKPAQPLIPFDVLKWLGEHRDGFLVGGAVLYGLGYVVRWLYASAYGLGDIPALNFQYVMSGIIPALLVALAWAAVAFFAQLRSKLSGVFEKRRLLGRVVATLPLFGAIFVMNYFGVRRIGPAGNLVAIIIIFASVYVMELTDESDGSSSPINKYYVPIFACVVACAVYLMLYPHIPRQLGGPQPRLACVDLVRDEIAPSTLEELTSGSTAKPGCPGLTEISMRDAKVGTEKVVHSKRLDVYFASSDYLLVRAASLDPSSPMNANILYELRKETIRAIQWCDEDP